jgi:Protein of unknown function (DUF2795)
MEQGNSKHGPIHDESLKHETQGLIRAGRSTHAEEWRDPEPAGDDQPPVSAGSQRGGAPPGMTPRDVADRSALASHLGHTVYPADRDALLSRLAENNAPSQFVDRVATLPADETYQNVQEVAVALGLSVESKRF